MSGFDSRRKTFESRGQHDQFVQFKILSRRNRKIALWAAKLMNISSTEAEKFVNDIVALVSKKPDDGYLIKLLMTELETRNIEMSEIQLQRQFGYFYQDARMEVMSDG